MKLTEKGKECAENEETISCRYSLCILPEKSGYSELEEPGKNNGSESDNKSAGYLRSFYSIYHLSYISLIFIIISLFL